MFNAYEFTFAGESSEMYGVHIYDFGSSGQKAVSFGNKADIVETRLVNRVRPIHYGVNYHASPLEFSFVFGSIDKELDRYEMEDIALWLTGHQEYQWLSIGQPDLEHVQFRCIITQLTPIHNGWLPYAFEATARCDCPYAYGYPFERRYTINGETNVLFQNEGSCREYLSPTLAFSPEAGVGKVRVVNTSDGNRTFEITGLPSGVPFTVDCSTGIITATQGQNLYSGFNMVFPRFVHGDNSLIVTGNGTMAISGRFLYNVAG